MSGDILLVIVVGTALAFDFTNGFHDTANVVATSISTRAIGPKQAVAFASLLNFAGAFISLKVATTIAKGFVDTNAVTTTVVFCGLVGAIAWNVITWYFGLPSSSSHALIGGLVGSVVAASGWSAVNGGGIVDNRSCRRSSPRSSRSWPPVARSCSSTGSSDDCAPAPSAAASG
ncbi:MAG: anion permease [Solirubrobacteraceae bacterium]